MHSMCMMVAVTPRFGTMQRVLKRIVDLSELRKVAKTNVHHYDDVKLAANRITYQKFDFSWANDWDDASVDMDDQLLAILSSVQLLTTRMEWHDAAAT